MGGAFTVAVEGAVLAGDLATPTYDLRWFGEFSAAARTSMISCR